ncbi:MAG: hypothetical protein ACRELX_00085, partial [Longimicrobiales bacterium]
EDASRRGGWFRSSGMASCIMVRLMLARRALARNADHLYMTRSLRARLAHQSGRIDPCRASRRQVTVPRVAPSAMRMPTSRRPLLDRERQHAEDAERGECERERANAANSDVANQRLPIVRITMSSSGDV